MRRRTARPQGNRILIATEGAGDAAFVTWLKILSEDHATGLVPIIKECGGGGPVSIHAEAVRIKRREERLRDEPFLRSAHLIDGDRELSVPVFEQEFRRTLENDDFRLIVQRPRLEGVHLRLHAGYERHFPQAGEDERLLRRVLPGIWGGNHRRALRTDQFAARFTLVDLHRAAPHDPELETLLRFVGLWPPP